MLGLIRKYQKSIYLFVTIIVVSSFTFFGTYSAFSQKRKTSVTAFITRNGVKVTSDEMHQMQNFLQKDAGDQWSSGSLYGGNFLNNSVIAEDFLLNGLFKEMVMKHAALFEEDLNAKMAKEKLFSLYHHPEASYIGVESIYQKVAPQALIALNVLRRADNPLDKEAFQARIDLYLHQKKWPSHYLKRLLYYQQQQSQWLKPDMSLQNRSLDLFHYKNINDWFGCHAQDLIVKTVFELSEMAQQKGYKVSRAEAEADLLFKAKENLSEMQFHKEVATNLTPKAHLKEQLRYLGLTFREAVSVWQKILQFKRLLLSVDNSLVLSPTIEKDFTQFVKEKRDVIVYHFSDHFQINSFEDLQLLYTYFVSTVPEFNMNSFTPNSEPQVDTAFEKAPELVVKRFHVKVKELLLDNLVPSVTLKNLWNYTISDNGWAQVIEQFPKLLQTDVDDRLAALNDLTQDEMNEWTKAYIIQNHSSLIDEAFDAMAFNERVIELSADSSKALLDPKENREEIVNYLLAAEQGEEIKIQKELSSDKICQLVIPQGNVEYVLLPYSQAKKTNVLKDLLAKQLAGKEPEAFFAPLLARLKGCVASQKEIENKDHLAKWAFYEYLASQKALIDQGEVPDLSSSILVQKKETLQRDEDLGSIESLFSMNEGDFSSIYLGEKGLQFFQLDRIKKDGLDSETLALLQKTKKQLTDSVRQEFYKKMIDHIDLERSLLS